MKLQLFHISLFQGSSPFPLFPSSIEAKLCTCQTGYAVYSSTPCPTYGHPDMTFITSSNHSTSKWENIKVSKPLEPFNQLESMKWIIQASYFEIDSALTSF